jgi:hypothetical protein
MDPAGKMFATLFCFFLFASIALTGLVIFVTAHFIGRYW